MKYCCFIFVVLCSLSLRAVPYYVATTGNDALDGLTLGNAKLTLQDVINDYDLASGDIIYLSAGTYTEKDITLEADDEGFTIQGAALSSGAPTTIYDSDQTGRWLSFFSANNDNITIDKITVKDYKPAGGTASGGGININALDVTGITVTSCLFDNCDTGLGGYDGGAINLYIAAGSASTWTLTDNTFRNCDASSDGGAVSIQTGADTDVNVTRCIFNSNSCAATGAAVILHCAAGATLTMTNCLLYENAVGTNNHGTIYTGSNTVVTMWNCTMYGNTASASYTGGVYTTRTGCSFTNCLFYGNTYRDVTRTIGTVNINYCCYEAHTGCTVDGFSFTTNPALTNTAADDYTLSISSPCINTGTNTGTPSTDILSYSRTGTYDIGCYEFVCSTSYSGTYNVGPTGTWTTLTAAIAALKICMTDDVILELQSTYVSGGSEAAETYPLDFTRMPTSASVTLTIRPKSDVGSVFTLDGSSTTTLILLDGTDYVTFDGRLGGAGSASYLTIENTSTATGGSAIRFVNDATNNTIKYCTLKSNFTSSTWGVVWFSTSTGSTGNDDNSITYCTIDGTAGATASPTSGVAQNGIYSLGTTGLTNSGNSITYNEFKDIFANVTATTSSMIFLDGFNDAWTISNNSFYQTNSRTNTTTLTLAIEIINIDDGDGYTISSNFFGGSAASATGTWTVTQTSTGRINFYGISLTVGTTTGTSIQGNVFKNFTWNIDNATYFSFIYSTAGKFNIGTTVGNQIGTTTGTGSIQILSAVTPGITVNLIQIASVSTVNIQNNTIGSISTTNSSGIAYTIVGIKSSGAAGIFTISSNSIGSTSTANSIAIGGASTAAGICSFTGISNSATGLTTINSNTIQNCTVYGTSDSEIRGIYNNGSATNSTINSNAIISINNSTAGTDINAYTFGIYNVAAAALSMTSNTIYTITANNGYFAGIYDAVAATGTHTISLNIIGNTSSDNIAIVGAFSSAQPSFGIYIGNTGTYTISSNKIQNITLSGAASNCFAAIYVGSTGTYNMTSNEIKNIKNSNAGAYSGIIYGVYFSSSPTSSLIEKNRMTGFSTSQTTTPALYGFYTNFGGTLLIYNNVFTCTNAGNTNNTIICGIYMNLSVTITIYHNTISIGGSPSSGSSISAPFYDNSITGNEILACRNNIFQNLRTNGGTATGKHPCIYLNSAGSMTNGACNNNFYYAPVDASFAYSGAYRTAAVFNSNTQGYGGTASKYSLSITVTQATGVVPGATTSDVLNQGYDLFTGGTVTQDKDNNARDAAPWIGAFESITALPIKLVYFSGEKEARNNKLSWGTESELNNDYFTIEKSINGSDFTVVGMENGAGTSTQFLQYEMMDNNVEKVINYYRLLQTDFDGKYTVSDLISIDNREGDAARGDVILRTNTVGQEVNEMYRGLVIIVYSNGTSEKVIQ
jgi:hypothetical protein